MLIGMRHVRAGSDGMLLIRARVEQGDDATVAVEGATHVVGPHGIVVLISKPAVAEA